MFLQQYNITFKTCWKTTGLFFARNFPIPILAIIYTYMTLMLGNIGVSENVKKRFSLEMVRKQFF